ncbi:retron St85 family effector protein [uncultured Eubacterium sp.]|uniref:retron St85 family effector protein n=1 Tax=uncultured Eubacterium sp. TaxID=165185 RepID=UPI002597B59F|nr:retron St85 family effector protein [uncultured Eubacterium sp.]
MVDLWKDTEIIKIVNEIKNKKRVNSFKSKIVPKFIFICGSQIVDENGKELSEEELKNNIRYYIARTLNEQMEIIDYGKNVKMVNCVFSEHLYNQDLAEDILSFEEVLAEISDYIIIVVESPGTYCELGAFVLNDKFMKKTIVINEDKPQFEKSFITRGPIKKVRDNNPENVILHSGLDRIKISTQFKEKMDELSYKDVEIEVNKENKEQNLKTLIYEFANIVELFQPIESYEMMKLHKQIFGNNDGIKNKNKHKIRTYQDVVILMEKMNIITKKKGMYYLNGESTFFNVIASIDRKEFNELRLSYLSRIYKLAPQRME